MAQEANYDIVFLTARSLSMESMLEAREAFNPMPDLQTKVVAHLENKK